MKNEENSLLQALAQSLQNLEDKEKLISKLSQELMNSQEKYTELRRKYQQQSKKHEKFESLLEYIEQHNEIHILQKMLEKQVEKEEQLNKMSKKCKELQNKAIASQLQVKRLEKLIVSLRKGEQVSQLLNFTDEQIMKKQGQIDPEPIFYPMK